MRFPQLLLYSTALFLLFAFATGCGRDGIYRTNQPPEETLPPDSPIDGGNPPFLPTPAHLVFPTTIDFRSAPLTTNNLRTVELSNTGDLAVTSIQSQIANAAPYSFENGFPGRGGNCGARIEGHSSCLFTVSFRPTEVKQYSDLLSLSFVEEGTDGATRNVNIALTGAGNEAALLAFSLSGDPENLVSSLSWGLLALNANTRPRTTVHVHHFGRSAASAIQFNIERAAIVSGSSTCGTLLSADNPHCQFDIEPNLSAVGSDGIIHLGYNNGSYGSDAFFSLFFRVGTPAQLSFTGPTDWKRVKGYSYPMAISVTNNGTEAAVLSPMVLSGAGYTFPNGNANPCGAQINGGSSCSLVVTFSPTTAGNYAGSLTVPFQNGFQATSTAFSLAGIGADASALSVTPNGADWGTLSYGRPVDKTFTLKNASTSVKSSNGTISATSPFFVQSSNCGTLSNGAVQNVALDPGASCTVTIRYKTPVTTGNFQSDLAISYFDGTPNGSAVAVTPAPVLSGASTADVTLVASTLDFGDVAVGTPASLTIPKRLGLTITYYGGREVTADFVPQTSFFKNAGGSAYPGAGSSCPKTFSGPPTPGYQCAANLEFTPTLIQSYTDSATLSWVGPAQPARSANVQLRGQGVAPALLTSMDADTDTSTPEIDIDGGTSPIGVAKKIVIRLNHSGYKAVVSSNALVSPFSYAGGSFPGNAVTPAPSIPLCSSSISVASCYFSIVFAPSAAGNFTQNVTLTYPDGTSAPSKTLKFIVHATGTNDAILSLSGGDVGNVRVNQTGTGFLTVTNTGFGPASQMAFSTTLQAPFAQIAGGSCGSSLAVGQSCTFKIQFHPTVPGKKTMAVSVAYNNGSSSTSVSGFIKGTGTLLMQVASGGMHNCAILPNPEDVKCWGSNESAQLGTGESRSIQRGDAPGEMTTLPRIPIPSGHWAIAVAAGEHHSCILTTDAQNHHDVYCWGGNLDGQLGLETSEDYVGDTDAEMNALVPVNLGIGVSAQQISVGYAHVCILDQMGRVKCWGNNTYGQLGIESTVAKGRNAGDMGDGLPFVDLGGAAKRVQAGHSHTCAIMNDDSVKCWGANFYGQLGLGDTNDRGTAAGTMGSALSSVNLGAGKTAVQISAGGGFTFAVLNDGKLKGWGVNRNTDMEVGMLGFPACETNDVNQTLGACDDPSGMFSVVLRGVGTRPQHMSQLSSLSLGNQVVSVSSGKGHTCAILADGTLRCFGLNGEGQLGLGNTNVYGDQSADLANLPAVSLPFPVKSISTGDHHTCAVGDPGVICWGDDSFGQLGLGEGPNRIGDDEAIPTTVIGF